MTNKVQPLRRDEILSLAVTQADAFTALRHLRHRETVPAIPDLEEKGSNALPGIEGSLLDLYYTLWDPEPGVKSEVAPARRYWHGILTQAMATSAFGELRSQTQLHELKAVLGTISMGESVLAMVPRKDQQKLQELAATQAEADELDEQAQQAQAQAQALQAMAQAAGEAATDPANGGESGGQPQKGAPGEAGDTADSQGAPSNQPGNAPTKSASGGRSGGQPSQSPSTESESSSAKGSGQMSPEQAKALANQLADAAAKAQAEAEAAKDLADEAKAKAEKQATELLGEPGSQQAQDKQRELARLGLQAAKDAQAKVEEVSETIEAWGLDEGEFTRKPIPEALSIMERMRRTEAFRKFAALLGRVRQIAARKAKSKIAGEGVRITVPETGRDIRRAVSAELVALTHPATRVQALTRWAHGELRLNGQQTKKRLGHGPVIVCEDSSGSMNGEKHRWAKAAVLSLALYAKLQKRSFGWIMFDYGVRRHQTYPQGQMTAEQMLEIAEARSGGGTDFESPLRKALEMIREAGLKKADIAFITDGECAVSDAFRREFLAAKKALEINVIAILCDVGSSSDSSLREFADRIETVSSFTADEAETKLFRHL